MLENDLILMQNLKYFLEKFYKWLKKCQDGIKTFLDSTHILKALVSLSIKKLFFKVILIRTWNAASPVSKVQMILMCWYIKNAISLTKCKWCRRKSQEANVSSKTLIVGRKGHLVYLSWFFPCYKSRVFKKLHFATL